MTDVGFGRLGGLCQALTFSMWHVLTCSTDGLEGIYILTLHDCRLERDDPGAQGHRLLGWGSQLSQGPFLNEDGTSGTVVLLPSAAL